MKLQQDTINAIIKNLLLGKDYRQFIIKLIDIDFLNFTISFFKKVAIAKMDEKDITVDWYKKEFLNPDLKTDDIITNSGLNKKTITNMHNSAKKEIVLNASNEHYESLYNTIQSLVDEDDEIGVTLTIKFKSVSVELTISESLIVINALAVKRASIRGGRWSAAGKNVEAPLMEAFCKLCKVSKEHFSAEAKVSSTKKNAAAEREIDFYLYDDAGKQYNCEVKLMGAGNPESGDGAIARGSDIFIADKLGNKKEELDRKGINWVELRSEDRFEKFIKVLDKIGIPCELPTGNIAEEIDKMLN